MMKFLFDLFPIVFFFTAYKLFDIYIATFSTILISGLQLLTYKIVQKRIDKMQLLSFLVILVLGGATLFFHNPWFIKWKPTAIYWITTIVLLYTAFFSNKPLIQNIMEKHIALPRQTWLNLNHAWAIFFMLMGALNLYVACYYSTDDWVKFKLFASTGFTLTFVLIQAIYLAKQLARNTVLLTNTQDKSDVNLTG